MTVVLEVTAAGRFFHIFFSSKNTSLKRRLKQFIHLFYLHVLQSFDQRYCNQLLSEIRNQKTLEILILFSSAEASVCDSVI